jgi:hypothetical protein
VDGTGSGSCPVAGFGSSGIKLPVVLPYCTMNQFLIKSIPNASDCGILHSGLLNF